VRASSQPCRDRREAIAALVTGELSEGKATELREHAAGCEGCRQEIEALEPVAALLMRADPDRIAVATTASPPAHVARELAERLEAERERHVAERPMRRRWSLRLGVAAAAAAAVFAVAVTLILSSGSEGPHVRTVAFDTGDPRVGLTASLTPREWGTEVSFAVRGIEEGTRCRVWLRQRGGGRVEAGSFTYRYGLGSDAADLTAALPGDDVASVEVKAGGQTFVAPVRPPLS
jgi:hypothetical protein